MWNLLDSYKVADVWHSKNGGRFLLGDLVDFVCRYTQCFRHSYLGTCAGPNRRLFRPE